MPNDRKLYMIHLQENKIDHHSMFINLTKAVSGQEEFFIDNEDDNTFKNKPSFALINLNLLNSQRESEMRTIVMGIRKPYK